MTLKVIMAPLTGSVADEAVLETAAAIARAFDAHVDAVFMKVDPREVLPYIGGEGMPATVLEELMQRNEAENAERARKARGKYDRWREQAKLTEAAPKAAVAGPTCAWHEFVGRPYRDWAIRARFADLLVIPRGEREGETEPSHDFEATLLESGRPVVLPGMQPIKSIGSRVVVAWDGGAEATHALVAAQPFLEIADKVTILQIAESAKRAADVQPLVDYLARHGVDADVRTESPGDRDIGEALLAEAAKLGGDLLVMGAYSHSRLRELVFGGATRYVLEGADLPILMVH